MLSILGVWGKVMSRRVNELPVDRVSKRQSNIGTRSLKLTSKHLFICYLVFSRNQLVYLSTYSLNTCSPVTLSSLTSNLFTHLLVNLSTCSLNTCSSVTLSSLTSNSFTRLLVYSSTCSLNTCSSVTLSSLASNLSTRLLAHFFPFYFLTF